MTLINYGNYSISWNKRHSNIFSEFINRLNSSRVKHFILRNYEGLPEINNSKDVDIIIEPKKYKIALKILKNVFKKFQISNYRIVKYERVHCCYGMDYRNHFSIHIDLIEGYLSKGFEVFSFDELYKQTIYYKNFRVLNQTYDSIMLLYYKVIGAKQLKEKYKEKILSNYKLQNSEINRVLKATLSAKMSNLLIESLSNNDFNTIVTNSKELSKDSKLKVFLNKPFKTSYRIVQFLIEKTYRIVYCPRKFQNFISVQGADGTGKSTFIEGLSKSIAYFNVSELSKSHVYHHRPEILPNLAAVGQKTGIMKEDNDFTNPHRAKPAGFISSFIRMTYYWLDYFFGVPLMLRKDVQFDRFTIYDRYIYDFLIDPYRSRINLPYWLRKLFTKTVIQPRIVFILLTDAETIYKRKQELSIKEINRQLNEFTKLAATHERFVIIDASQSPQEMVKEASKVIIDKFTSKLT